MNKTAWFGPKRKPELTGVYETKDDEGITGFQYWNGKYWGAFGGTSVRLAKKGAGTVSHWQENKWRGLANDPSKAR